MKKRRHHHVWRRYLKAWTTKGKILCLAGEEVFPTSTINVAVDRDFYALEKWTKQDEQYAIALVQGMPNEVIRAGHLELLELLMLGVAPKFEGLSREIDDEISTFRANVLEDRHAAIERAVEPLLERALHGDLAFYTDPKECIHFLNYLCTQNLRTKGVRERLLRLNAKTGMPDISRIWSFLALAFGQNSGCGLYVERRRRKLVLVQNNTDLPFITGDQPVANLLAIAGGPPEHFALYYPISPYLALVLNEVDQELPLTTETLTIEDVHGLNAKIASGCHAQLFGTSEKALRAAKDDAVWTP
jgi:hypothetical protein